MSSNNRCPKCNQVIFNLLQRLDHIENCNPKFALFTKDELWTMLDMFDRSALDETFRENHKKLRDEISQEHFKRMQLGLP